MRQRHPILSVVLLVSFVPAFAGILYAQVSRTSGRVVDASGAPVAAARVTGDGAPVLTDADGRFIVHTRADGTLLVEKASFAARVVHVEEPATPLRVVLDIGAVTEHVIVESPVVDAVTFDRFGSVRTIVSAAQVQDLNAIDLASALRRTPGVTISRFNPVGSFGGAEGGSVHIRGVGASRPGSEIKTFVDGAPFYMGLWGHPLLDLLPVGGADHVTVVKGPQPQVVGNTFSAIDVTLKRPVESLQAHARISGGAFATLVQQADVAGRAGAWEYAGAQGFARADGHREDADGQLTNVFGRIGYRLGRGWAVSGSVLHVDNQAGDPGLVGRPETKAGRYETAGTLGSITVRHDLARAHGVLQLHKSGGEGNWFDQLPPDGDTYNRFSLAGVRWAEDVAAWAGGTLSGGVTLDRIDGTAVFEPERPAPAGRFDGAPMTLASPHLAVAQTFPLAGRWTLSPSLGVRHYVHSEFGSETAPHAGLVVRSPGPWAVRANYARGVNYPGPEVVVLSTLIPPLRDTWRTLRAERMDHVEAGVSVVPTTSTMIDATLFTDRFTNRFVFAFPPLAVPPAFLNLGSYTTRGGEVAVQQQLPAGWALFGGLTLLDSTRSRLPYAPRASVVLGLTGSAGPVRIAVDAQSQSAMYVFGRGRTPVATDVDRVEGFTVVHLRPSYRLPAFGGAVDVFVAVENLFDTSYAYRPGYPMPGASMQVGVVVAMRGR